MRVHINESRSERQTGSVDIPGIGNRKRRPGDRADPVVLNQNRALKRRRTGAVDNTRTGNKSLRHSRTFSRIFPLVSWYCRETWRPAFEMLSRALSEISRVRRTVSF